MIARAPTGCLNDLTRSERMFTMRTSLQKPEAESALYANPDTGRKHAEGDAFTNMDGPKASVVSASSAESNTSVKRLLPWLVAVAFFLESLDTKVLNTAVPAIAKALSVAPLSMKSVLSSYTLSLAGFIPLRGRSEERRVGE